ncbi:MAG: cupin domain-containing protein [Bacteroidales bacterium]|jgi:quercetin dioxygenase-like cupin family protein|nr:cupin domain-containing protein [Bacteroidales bacterium]
MNETFPKATILNVSNMIDYSDGGIISKQVLKNDVGNITLFSFDKGQGLSEHTASFDAVVQILEGEAEIIIDKKPLLLKTGESVIMPANISHALNAVSRFKMLLTMIKG